MKQRKAPEKTEVKLVGDVLDVAEGTRFNPGEQVVVPARLTRRAVKRQKKFDLLVELLREDPRMPLTKMSKRSGIPTSTLFDMMREISRFYRLELTLVRRPEHPEPKWRKQAPTSEARQHALPELVGVCA